jgi:ABC-type uncharacterized transport system ATPase subunit
MRSFSPPINFLLAPGDLRAVYTTSRGPVLTYSALIPYPEDDSEKDVLADVTLDLPWGVISLIEQNGSSKTTFLMLAGGVLLPTMGKVHIRGSDTASLRDEEERHHWECTCAREPMDFLGWRSRCVATIQR